MKSLPLQIKKLSAAIGKPNPKILVYGPSGVGKTSLIPTLPGRILIISAEKGLLALSAVADDDRFDVLEVSTIEEVAEGYRIAALGGYDWVVLDSISEVAEVLLILEKKAHKDARQAYGELGDRTGNLLRVFRDLDCGVLFLAKRETKKGVPGDPDAQRYGVKMPQASLVDVIPHQFDEVFHLDFFEVLDKATNARVRTRALQTGNSSLAMAKDRSGTLPPLIPPDLGTAVALIRAGVRLPLAPPEAIAAAKTPLTISSEIEEKKDTES